MNNVSVKKNRFQDVNATLQIVGRRHADDVTLDDAATLQRHFRDVIRRDRLPVAEWRICVGERLHNEQLQSTCDIEHAQVFIQISDFRITFSTTERRKLCPIRWTQMQLREVVVEIIPSLARYKTFESSKDNIWLKR